ncbi:MAG: NADH-quinone oxidoreductase subunit N [Fimbriimonadaceae bacterium]
MEIFHVPNPTIDWVSISPVIALVVTGMLGLLIEMIRPKKAHNAIIGVTLAGIVAAGALLVLQVPMPNMTSFGGMVLRDTFGVFAQLLVLLATFLTVLFSEQYFRDKHIPFGEFYPMLVWCAVGGLIMCSTNNLLMLFIGIEVLSISLYVLAGLSKKEQKSEESALKYFLLGAFSSAFLLFGVALTYGATGTLELETVARAWVLGDATQASLLIFGAAMLIMGLAFKVALVPFHQWTPDVYQGAPTNISAFMSAGTKIASFAALWRVLEAFAPLSEFWLPALTVIAVLSMVVGNVVACLQKDVKRVLGYSSIGHAGYILVAVIAYFQNPLGGSGQIVLYYLAVYTLATVGAFAVISLAASKGQEDTSLANLNGLYKRSPFAAVALLIFMASLTGIPPTAGFFAKLLVFMDAINSGLIMLSVVLALTSAVSVYFYMGIAYAAFKDPEPEQKSVSHVGKMGIGLVTTCALCVIGIFGAILLQAPILNWMSF